jgi:hypothetical protein
MPNWNPRPERPFDYAAASDYQTSCTSGSRELSSVANRRAGRLASARADWTGGHRRASDDNESRLAHAWGDLTSGLVTEAGRVSRAIEEAWQYDRARAHEIERWNAEATAEAAALAAAEQAAADEARRRHVDGTKYFPDLDPGRFR